jgi:lipoyl(octanoyl) transferase
MAERRLETIRIAEPQGYAAMLDRQLARHKAVVTGEAPNTLYLLEHTPVVTLGREAHVENLLLARAAYEAEGIDLIETSRGGDVTYHGPGQLVAYPILNLNEWKLSVGWYLRTLESVLIDLLADYGLQGERVEGLTGVWVGGAKVAAIGVGLRRWTTFHGIALNVSPNMAHFKTIIPCGITDKPVTSLAMLLESPPDLEMVASAFDKHFRRHFDV